MSTASPQDVWDMCWAADNPELLAIMEKGRMYVLRGMDPEEPVNSSASLAAFSDLQVRHLTGLLAQHIMQA